MSEELAQTTQELSLEETTKSQDQTVLSTGAEGAESVELKHPLNTSWTLWYTKPQSQDAHESWSDLLKPVITFSTVEEFWGIFNSIPSAQDLPLKGDYHLFREGIKPEWEDAANANGGKWSYQFKNKNNTDINEIWLRGLLSLIGETIQDDEDEVNGIVINNRAFAYRVLLWTKTTEKKKLFNIGEKFKKVLKLRDEDSIEFFSHKDAEVKGAKPILVI
jgi:translation initiation factor 4E